MRAPQRTPRGRAQGVVSAGLVLATGLTPCASAIIILLFAFGQELYLVGVAACLVMAVGMGLTVSLVGLAAVAARRGTVRMVGPSSAAAHWLKTALGVTGAAAITGLGAALPERLGRRLGRQGHPWTAARSRSVRAWRCRSRGCAARYGMADPAV